MRPQRRVKKRVVSMKNLRNGGRQGIKIYHRTHSTPAAASSVAEAAPARRHLRSKPQHSSKLYLTLQPEELHSEKLYTIHEFSEFLFALTSRGTGSGCWNKAFAVDRGEPVCFLIITTSQLSLIFPVVIQRPKIRTFLDDTKTTHDSSNQYLCVWGRYYRIAPEGYSIPHHL